MTRTRKLLIALVAVAATGLVGVACSGDGSGAPPAAEAAEGMVMAPVFEVDPLWPQPLPNNWILGSAIGVTVDSRDHVWIIHRQNCFNDNTECGAQTTPGSSECCVQAPNILEFDPEGNLVSSFGGPGEGYDWPNSNHGITADPMDNLWIGGNGGGDAHILKFARDGTFLAQYGRAGEGDGNTDMEDFGMVAEVAFDADASEVYVADGYGNSRIVVLDMATGEFKRLWGAYGNPPRPEGTRGLGRYDPAAPPSEFFRTPVHCAEPAMDDRVYVCDRVNDRIQVFQKDGTFVQELFVAPNTLGDGSTWDIAFSKDPDQTYIYLADGKNMKIWVIERSTMEILTSFGQGGRQPGTFYAVHSIATDSQGNIYTTETYEGKRVQKFVYKGMGNVAEEQDAVWPTSAGGM